MNRNELDELPPVLDVPTAAKVLGIGRSLAYELVRRGEWPTTVLHVGKLIKIPTEPLVRLLGADEIDLELGCDHTQRIEAALDGLQDLEIAAVNVDLEIVEIAPAAFGQQVGHHNGPSRIGEACHLPGVVAKLLLGRGTP